MGLSTHYTNERKLRESAIISRIGLGEIVYRGVVFDNRRGKNYIYEVSSTAIMTVRAYDEPTLVITRYPARPSRIKQFWQEATEEVIKVSIRNTRLGYVF